MARTIESGQVHAINCYIADILPNAAMAHPDYLAQHGIETVTVPGANFHTPVLADPDGIVETRELVIATATMPRPDWVKARIFSWAAEFLFFKPGTVRIPLWLLHRVGGVPMRQLLEAFLQDDPAYPVTRWVQQFLRARAEEIQGAPPCTPLVWSQMVSFTGGVRLRPPWICCCARDACRCFTKKPSRS